MRTANLSSDDGDILHDALDSARRVAVEMRQQATGEQKQKLRRQTQLLDRILGMMEDTRGDVIIICPEEALAERSTFS